MPVVLHFGSLCQGEAQTGEYVHYLVLDYRQRVACAQGDGVGRAGEVHGGAYVGSCIRPIFQFLYLGCDVLFQLVQLLAQCTLLL